MLAMLTAPLLALMLNATTLQPEQRDQQGGRDNLPRATRPEVYAQHG